MSAVREREREREREKERERENRGGGRCRKGSNHGDTTVTLALFY